MSLVLTTFGASDPIDATELRSRNESVRRYVGEGIVAADRAASWMTATHVYKPDFFIGAHQRSRKVSGESVYRSRGRDTSNIATFSYYLGTAAGTAGLFKVPSLNATLVIPEDISTNGGHRVRVFASFYAWEFGGTDNNATGAMLEDAIVGAYFNLSSNGSYNLRETPIYKGSQTDLQQRVALYPRKQVVCIEGFDLNAGIYDIGISIRPVDPGSDLCKHVFVLQGNLVIRWHRR